MKINKPDHYSKGIEVIKFLNSWPDISFSVGNVVKYIMRAPYKHDSEREDLLKALYYLMNEIECKGYKEDAVSFLKEKFLDSQPVVLDNSEVFDSIEQYKAENFSDMQTISAKEFLVKEFFEDIVRKRFYWKSDWRKVKHSSGPDIESLVFDTEDGAIVNFRLNLKKDSLDIRYKPTKRLEVSLPEEISFLLKTQFEQKYISIPSVLEKINLLELPIDILHDEIFREHLTYDCKNIYDFVYLLNEFNSFVSTL
jgi:hypothetical protein